MKITPEQIRKDLLKNGSKMFTVWFRRRTDKTGPTGEIIARAGDIRKMVCRLHVRKGVKGVVPYDISLQRDLNNNLLRVFEMAGDDSGYKCIPLDSVVKYSFTVDSPDGIDNES